MGPVYYKCSMTHMRECVWWVWACVCVEGKSPMRMCIGRERVTTSLVPRPSTPPVFEYAKTEGEGLGNLLT